MKRIIYLMLFVLASFNVVAQTDKPKATVLNEYVFEMPYMDLEKQMSSFKASLAEIPNIEFYGFCETRKVLMVRMAENSLPLFKELLEKKDYLYYQKREISFASAEQDCNAKEEINYSRSIQ